LVPKCFEPYLAILPAAQQEIWPRLRQAAQLGFVLYGGTAVALHLGHRASVDYDFFRAEPLDKSKVRGTFPFIASGAILQEDVDTLVVSCGMPSGAVKLSFFGSIDFGRISDPLQTTDGAMLVASLDDLLATKLKTILDRAEARDYQDIAAMLRSGGSLERGLGAFRAMFGGEPATVLRAIGWFNDGNLPALSDADREVLLDARDRVRVVPQIAVVSDTLAIPLGECDEIVPLRQR
jgi:hypothetical protein